MIEWPIDDRQFLQKLQTVGGYKQCLHGKAIAKSKIGKFTKAECEYLFLSIADEVIYEKLFKHFYTKKRISTYFKNKSYYISAINELVKTKIHTTDSAQRREFFNRVYDGKDLFSCIKYLNVTYEK